MLSVLLIFIIKPAKYISSSWRMFLIPALKYTSNFSLPGWHLDIDWNTQEQNWTQIVIVHALKPKKPAKTKRKKQTQNPPKQSNIKTKQTNNNNNKNKSLRKINPKSVHPETPKKNIFFLVEIRNKQNSGLLNVCQESSYHLPESELTAGKKVASISPRREQ